jgi:hypothetical protein
MAARGTKKRKGASGAALDLQSKLDEKLRNWNDLNKKLMKMGEEEVAALLEAEKKSRGRLSTLLRLQSRLNRLRRERERHQLHRNAKR